MERIIREVPESEYSDEVEELWSPRPSYFARVMDSVAEYGLQVKVRTRFVIIIIGVIYL